ncbi:MAG: hypothetical protein AW07_00765 [Candidatus Accumulibacter sp. SK-11]|nr:MAG: hypothetical protein AW07_00765 [Candidatus Accumulibacter sp. SK-11]
MKLQPSLNELPGAGNTASAAGESPASAESPAGGRQARRKSATRRGRRFSSGVSAQSMARSIALPYRSVRPIAAAAGIGSSRSRARLSVGKWPVTSQYRTPASE